MSSSAALLLPNLSILCYSNDNIINNKIKAQEQKAKIMKDLLEIAEKELRENESSKRECLAHMREWIKQNPDLENCLTDDTFLLRFLRVKKYSIHMAEQTLLKYLNFRKRFQDTMYDLDYTLPSINELFRNGYILVSPFRDMKGRRVIITDASKFDLNKFNGGDLMKIHVITYETILDTDENQILGVRHIGDLTSISPAFISLMTIKDFTCIIRWGEQSFPMRHKEINLLNLPKPLKYVFDYSISHMSEKLRERFKRHESVEELHQHVDKHCLPAEMGGDMPAKEMIKLWLEELETKRERLLSFDAMKLLSDRGIIRRRNAPTQDDTGIGSLPGTFRKLELD